MRTDEELAAECKAAAERMDAVNTATFQLREAGRLPATPPDVEKASQALKKIRLKRVDFDSPTWRRAVRSRERAESLYQRVIDRWDDTLIELASQLEN